MRQYLQIRQSIGLMQTALLLVSVIVIGFGISAWQLRTALADQRATLSAHLGELFDLSASGASRAAWALDMHLAGEVVQGIAARDGVSAAEIRAHLSGGKRQVLSRIERLDSEFDALEFWIGQRYFSDIASRQVNLQVVEENRGGVIGDMQIELNPYFAARRFLALVYANLAATLLQALLVGLVLALVSYWLVAAPLRRAAAAISRIDPERLDHAGQSLDVPRLHRNDELGLLLNHTNLMLERLVQSQHELRHLATRDELTGLPNRNLIQQTLNRMLASASRNEQRVAVIFIDLDRFKSINDSLGHDTGDRLLVQVAKTLLERVREQDAVGRLGGDEFLIVMPMRHVNEVVTIVHRILEALDQPFEVDSVELRTGASLGIAMYPDDGENSSVLMRHADLAMYRAKQEGGSHWQLFSEEMRRAVDDYVIIENALGGALLRNELEIFLQPQFDSDGMTLAGCEALLRWRHDGQLIMPDRFIDVAERSGLIREIGDWVLAEVCRTMQSWARAEIPVAVNVSACQLAVDHFAERALKITRRYGVSPRLIRFEITESTLMHNLERTRVQLRELREQGFQISVDDFGTGYSSLAYLTRLPIDELKIDRSFVSGANRSRVVLNTIIAMARELDLRVVAEGIETESQRDELAAGGCHMLQGYLLGRPEPVPDFHACFNLPKDTPATINQPTLRSTG